VARERELGTGGATASDSSPAKTKKGAR
jgi:hypothetical protein